MIPKQDLPSILLGLGTTPAQVAATLKASGIQGVRNTLRHLNPIVRYVERQLAIDDYQLCVEQSNLEMLLQLTMPNGKIEKAKISGAVKSFLDAFNSGAFSELELPPENDKRR
jgi:hypothetical protein